MNKDNLYWAMLPLGIIIMLGGTMLLWQFGFLARAICIIGGAGIMFSWLVILTKSVDQMVKEK